MYSSKTEQTTIPPMASNDDTQGSDRFDAVFDYQTATSSDLTSESDVSEYGKRRRMSQSKNRKRKVKTKPKKGYKTQHPYEPVSLPEMSDEALSRDPSPETRRPLNRMKRLRTQIQRTTRKQMTEDASSSGTATPTQPAILQLHIEGNASKVINLDVGKLLHDKRKYDEADLSQTTTVIGDTSSGSLSLPESINEFIISSGPMSKRRQLLMQAKAKKLTSIRNKTSFTSLPYEVREDIYFRVFVKESALDFTSRVGFPRSAAFLRTCREVYYEGRRILYGENAFHFKRSHERRGNYWTSTWVEIGFKDVRRFLEQIGTTNLSYLQYVSFDLCDAAPSGTPGLTENDRRFVNDPVLHHIFGLIGAHAHLLKFAFECSPRKSVSTLDYHFLRSLGEIRAQEVIYTSECWSSANKVPVQIISNLKRLMTVAKDNEDEVDQSKKKKSIVKMHYEREPRPRSRW